MAFSVHFKHVSFLIQAPIQTSVDAPEGSLPALPCQWNLGMKQ